MFLTTLLTSGTSVLVLAAMLATDPVSIRKFSVPAYAEYHGYSGEIVSKFLRERIRHIAQEAGTARGEVLSVFHDDVSAIEILAERLQLGGLVDAVQEFMNLQVYSVGGYLLLENGEMKIGTRVETAKGEVFFLSASGGRDIRTLINKMAEMFVERVDPYVLALYYFRKEYPSGNFVDAPALVEHCISVLPTPQKQWPMLLKGRMAYRAGQYEEAIASYQRALALDPDFAFALARWGEALVAMGDVQGGLDNMRLAVSKKNATAVIFQLLGDTLARNSFPEEAREAYIQGLQETPDDPGLQISLARLYLDHRQPEPALALLEKAVIKRGDDVETHILLTQALQGVITHRRAALNYDSQFSTATR
ncbi:TPR repeat-containing protein [Desulfonatronum thiosulfatophilum]|uniref:TPR repeat-containing protein n=1 Tax=Desulfonatronum thiosulfatophilum TaxID=617002 RepID=A0A1G6DXS3_9BACT|nr:tetratricopeptide repeat protein [Desulfonatronum thiosulfatophilum]SDB49953.1 TPR repeat-containing protein [Desulfonatronum thiosulfatophilum]